MRTISPGVWRRTRAWLARYTEPEEVRAGGAVGLKARAPPADEGAITMAPTYSQSREFERVRIPMTAKISNPDRGVLSCPVRDLGLGGIFVEADDCLRSGDVCAMEICLDYNPDGPKLETYGRVVRLETGRGTAIEFTGMSPEAFDHLDRLMILNRENGDALDEDLARKHRRG